MVSKEKLYQLYVVENKELSFIRKTFYVSNEKIKEYLIRWNIPFRKPFEEEMDNYGLSKEKLYEEYIENDLTINQLMKKYKIRFKELKILIDRYGFEKVQKFNSIDDIDENEFRKYYIDENHSRNETINHFNISEAAFRQYVVQHKFKKSNISGKRKRIKLDMNEVKKFYIDENHTLRETAEYFNVDLRTLCRYLSKYNIRHSEETRLNNMYQTNLKKYGSKTKFGTEEFKIWRKEHIDDIVSKIEKTFMSKYGVKSFVETVEAKDVWKMGTSKTEQFIFERLKQIFPKTINGYKCDRYPFNCDFYIPEIDTFVEYQGFYTHGKEPYDENNLEHQIEREKLEKNLTKFNRDKLYVWCFRDPIKRKVAKENGLNYVELFSIKDFEKLFSSYF